jgi:hypothetical protein
VKTALIISTVTLALVAVAGGCGSTASNTATTADASGRPTDCVRISGKRLQHVRALIDRRGYRFIGPVWGVRYDGDVTPVAGGTDVLHGAWVVAGKVNTMPPLPATFMLDSGSMQSGAGEAFALNKEAKLASDYGADLKVSAPSTDVLRCVS